METTKKTKGIIFDMDGVLVDSTRLSHAYIRQLYQDFSWEDYQETVKESFWTGIEKFQDRKLDVNDQDKADMRQSYSELKSFSPIFPGIKELLDTFDQRYLFAVNTAARAQNTHNLLAKAGIESYFSHTLTRDDHPSKTEKAKMILSDWGFEAQDVVFVTDTLGDVRNVWPTGVQSIGVTWGVHDAAHFDHAPSGSMLAVVHTPGELQEVITRYYHE